MTVAVPVSDQDAAESFQQLGFETDINTELHPGFPLDRDGAACRRGDDRSSLPARSGVPAGIDPGIRLATADPQH